MSMRVKTLAILSLVAAAVVVADGLAERAVVFPKFLALEREEALRDLDRVEKALSRELDQLASSVRDYAQWDDAYAFLRTRDPAFVRSNLLPGAFGAFNLNMVHFYDGAGELVWGQTRASAGGAPTPIAGVPAAGFARNSPLFRGGEGGQPVSGLMRAGERLLLVASHPVVRSDGSGPVRGTLVFGRLFGKAEEEALRRQTSVALAVAPAWPDQGGGAEHAGHEEHAVDARGAGTLRLRVPLRGLTGRPEATLLVETPRRFTAEGEALIRNERVYMIVAAVALLAGAYLTFGQFVLDPLQRLTEHVLWVRQSGDLTRRTGMTRRDEVGTLAREFDTLLGQLDRSRVARLRSENRLKSVLQDQTDLIRRFLPDGTLTFVNRAYARFFGASEESLVGHPEQISVPEEDRPAVEAHLAALSESCRTAEVTHRVVLPNGEVRRLHWTTHAICDHDGRVIEFQSVGRDVTGGASGPECAAATEPDSPKK